MSLSDHVCISWHCDTHTDTSPCLRLNKCTALLVIYSSRICQILWRSTLYCKFIFFDWFPRFCLCFPHRGDDRALLPVLGLNWSNVCFVLSGSQASGHHSGQHQYASFPSRIFDPGRAYGFHGNRIGITNFSDINGHYSRWRSGKNIAYKGQFF